MDDTLSFEEFVATRAQSLLRYGYVLTGKQWTAFHRRVAISALRVLGRPGVPMLVAREGGGGVTAMAYEPYLPEDVLLDGFLALQTPEGFRAELIDGEIIVSPPPGGHHERAISRIVEQVLRQSQSRLDFSANRGLLLPSGGSCPKSHVIPDGVFAPRELDLFTDNASFMRPDGLALVLEVTSSHPGNDREAKRHCYARGGIPLYLLVDRERGTVTLFSEPAGDDYTESHAGVFGKVIELPAPFSFGLETEELA